MHLPAPAHEVAGRQLVPCAAAAGQDLASVSPRAHRCTGHAKPEVRFAGAFELVAPLVGLQLGPQPHGLGQRLGDGPPGTRGTPPSSRRVS